VKLKFTLYQAVATGCTKTQYSDLSESGDWVVKKRSEKETVMVQMNERFRNLFTRAVESQEHHAETEGF
jgi:predicted Fe-S protein YdhL (DUF1289 family)